MIPAVIAFVVVVAVVAVLVVRRNRPTALDRYNAAFRARPRDPLA